MNIDLSSTECRERAATERAAAQATNLEMVRQKHLAAADAWEVVAGQREFSEKKRAEREASAT